MSLIDVHSAASAGIVDALITVEAIRTTILLMIELPRASLLRGELQFCVSTFHCTRVVSSKAVVAPPKPWLRRDERWFRMWQMSQRPPAELTAPNSADSGRGRLHF